MNHFHFFKNFLLFIAILSFTICSLSAQHLFSVRQNCLPQEKVRQLKSVIANVDILQLPLSRNQENKEIFPFSISSAQNTQIIILNEETGNNVLLTPNVEWITEFQLAPFFIEELRQSALGDAAHYLLMETNSDFSVKKVAMIPVVNGEPIIPRYFYGKKENVKEALPKEREIIRIYKSKPRIISDLPDHSESDHYVAQLEESLSYYTYMYKLPDGTLCMYDEHFNSNNKQKGSKTGTHLVFYLSGDLTEMQRIATEYALELWSEQLTGTIPVDMSANFYSLGPGVLGMSFFPPSFFDTETSTWYPSALWNQMLGYDASSEDDVTIVMSSDFNFYFGLDGNGIAYNFVTIMIHEVAHGLGFFSTCREEGFFSNGNPGIYDRMLYQGLDGPCITELDEYERAELLISNNLYAGRPGSKLLEANNGVRVKIYAPSKYSSGSSAHHWDSSVSFPTFMKYAYSSPLHTYNTRKIGIFMDMGWQVPEIDPNAVWITFDGNSGTGSMSAQQFVPETAQKLRPNFFVKKGYTFSHWNTKPDGTGTSFQERELVTLNNDQNLYAQWEAGKYTLTFKPEGGTVDPASKQVIYDSPVGELHIPEKEGYVFEGWKIASNIITAETIWPYAGNVSTSAVWSLPHTISENHQTTALQVIPNPAKHTVEVRMSPDETGAKTIVFYNFLGQPVKTVPISGEMTQGFLTQKINLSELSAGIYVVKVGGSVVRLVISD